MTTMDDVLTTASKKHQFLSDEWKKKIKSQFSLCHKQMSKVDEIITHMYSADIISVTQKQNLDAMREMGKISRIMSEIVPRLNMEEYYKFRDILNENGNQTLASYLPGAEPYLPGPETCLPGGDCKPAGENYKTSANPDISEMRLRFDSAQPQGNQMLYAVPSHGHAQLSHSHTDNELLERKKYELSAYRKEGKKGLVVIFAFFTGELQGYQVDIAGLKEFFSEKHMPDGTPYYDVFICKNLSKQEFEKQLDEVKSTLNGGLRGPSYHSLIVIVLSHGDKGGILTCQKGSDKREELNQRIDMSDLINFFMVDKVEVLKDKPKFFIFQCCRGKDIVRVAANPDASQQQNVIPVDSDILVANSCTDGNKSVVSDQRGSWFINNFLKMARIFGKDTPVDKILKMVNREVADKSGWDGELRQMSSFYSTHRCDYYLFDNPSPLQAYGH